MTTPSINSLNTQTPVSTIQPKAELTAATGGKNELGKDEFLKLLVTQLTHQDPLDPTDPTEFVGQLSQLSSLEQLVNMREGLELLAVAQTAGTSADVVGFVGRNITFRGDNLVLDGAGDGSEVGIQVDGAASEVVVTLKNDKGEIVRSLKLGAKEAGKHVVNFDGKDEKGLALPEGQYSVSVSATDATGASVAASARTSGTVVAVSYDKGYPELVLEDGRRITLNQVLEVKDKSTSAATTGTDTPAGAGE